MKDSLAIQKNLLSSNHWLLLLVILYSLILTGCAAKITNNFAATDPDEVRCADLANLPQDLMPYAQNAGVDKILLIAEEQAKHAAKAKRRFFHPWNIKEPAKNLRKDLQNNFNLKPDKGFAENLRSFTAEAWAGLVENADAANYPSRKERAITVRNTSLRAMPTAKPYFLNPDQAGEGFPFDYFQHTALWLGTPVFISHVSKDGKWVLAETWISTGWLPAEDVASVNEIFQNTWQSLPLAAIIKDKVMLKAEGSLDAPTGQSGRAETHIGSLFPVKMPETARTAKEKPLHLLFPVRAANGTAKIAAAKVQPEEAALFPLKPTIGNVAKLGNEMMGQPYGWGGLFDSRDCSAMTRDIFIPLGLFMPRNSSAQGAWGTSLDLCKLEPDDKEACIIQGAVPFFSLVWLRGHIGLYLGEWQGRPIMYHNIWGLRVKQKYADGKPYEGRAVIGKAVVTTLRPGAELPEITQPASLLHRIERISILPEAEKVKK